MKGKEIEINNRSRSSQEVADATIADGESEDEINVDFRKKHTIFILFFRLQK